MSGDPWVNRCPKGHSYVRKHFTTSTYECRSCGVTYLGEPYDARDVVEFPVEGEHPTIDRIDLDDLLADLVDVCDRPDRTWAKIYEFEMSNRRTSVALAKLEKRGLVFKRGLSGDTKEAWQPTKEGRRQGRELNRGRVATDGGDDT